MTSDPFENVTSKSYDGRSFTHEDNSTGVGAYVGVDPIYQNYANEGERPYPFSQDELRKAAIRGGLDGDDLDPNDEVEGQDEDDREEEGDDEDEGEAEGAMGAKEPEKPSLLPMTPSAPMSGSPSS